MAFSLDDRSGKGSKWRNSLLCPCLTGNCFRRDSFAEDCVIRQRVSISGVDSLRILKIAACRADVLMYRDRRAPTFWPHARQLRFSLCGPRIRSRLLINWRMRWGAPARKENCGHPARRPSARRWSLRDGRTSSECPEQRSARTTRAGSRCGDSVFLR